ncbi:hypothetical protein COY95_01135 [Candidatus Woesearchaeota archaeon CG_4_10_14_0_8_um_filter_47_5]|nr:MAG: hypothetical protein COY95_01135 [Candidatus Woesearchaeota archaeon CG_4_10_14_0_8_um_filter_47_5]
MFLLRMILRYDHNKKPYRAAYDQKEVYERCPELRVIGKHNNHYLLHSPLLSISYLISEALCEDVFSEAPKNLELFVAEGLFVKKGAIAPRVFVRNPTKLLNSVTSVTIFLTTNCNLRCVYCYASGGEKNTVLKFETITAFLETFIKNGKPIEISWHGGGESTLYMDLIEKTIQYLRSKKLYKTSHIQTNGICSLETLRRLVKNKISIQLSCDGPPYIQDFQRPDAFGKPTSQVFERTVRYLIRKKISTNVRVTVSKYSVDKLPSVITYFRRIGITDIKFEPLYEMGRGIKTPHAGALAPTLMEYSDHLLSVVELLEMHGMNGEAATYSGLAGAKDCFCGTTTPNICLTTDGLLSACYESPTYSQNTDFLVYGSLNTATKTLTLDREKLEYLQRRTVHNLPHCKDCFLKYTCAGGCHIKIYEHAGDMYGQHKEFCDSRTIFSRELIIRRLESAHVKIKPYFKQTKNGLALVMYHNHLPFFLWEPEMKYSPEAHQTHPFIKIDSPAFPFTSLNDYITSYLDDKRYPFMLLAISCDLSRLIHHPELKPHITSLFLRLLKNKVPFLVTRPLPPCLVEPAVARKIKHPVLPASCFECSEMVFVQEDGSVTFCNKTKGSKKIEDYATRTELYREHASLLRHGPVCSFCHYRISHACAGYCPHSGISLSSVPSLHSQIPTSKKTTQNLPL